MSKQIQTIPAYFDIRDSNNVITIPGLEDFHAIVIDQKLSFVFLYEKCKTRVENDDRFFLTDSGIICSTPRKGFKDFQEAIEGLKDNIIDGKAYREFISSGCKNRSEYSTMRNDGFNNHKTMTGFYDLGLDKEYPKISGLRSDERVHVEFQKALSRINNKSSFLRFYIESAFPNPSEMIEIIMSGFDSVVSYQDAKKNGFKDLNTYTEIRNAGFKTYDEFINAKLKGITQAEQYYQYLKDIENAEKWDISIQEFGHIRECIIEKSVPNRISAIYEKIISIIAKNYGTTYHFTNEFLFALDTFSSFLNAIQNEDSFSELKYSVKQGISLEIEDDHYCKVIVDASNVCWYRQNSLGHSGKLPAKDLLEMHSLLKLYKADEILFVADANLRHEVDNVEVLNQLEKDGYLIYSTGEQADKRILSMAENRGYLIISNDQYRDWLADSEFKINRIGFHCVKDFGFDLSA